MHRFIPFVTHHARPAATRPWRGQGPRAIKGSPLREEVASRSSLVMNARGKDKRRTGLAPEEEVRGMKHRGKAVIVQHCAVYGRLETPVRYVDTGEVRGYAQYDRSLLVRFQRPRERRTCFIQVVPCGSRYLQVEVGGRVVFDSRDLVPCDMAWWHAVRGKYEESERPRVVNDTRNSGS